MLNNVSYFKRTDCKVFTQSSMPWGLIAILYLSCKAALPQYNPKLLKVKREMPAHGTWPSSHRLCLCLWERGKIADKPLKGTFCSPLHMNDKKTKMIKYPDVVAMWWPKWSNKTAVFLFHVIWLKMPSNYRCHSVPCLQMLWYFLFRYKKLKRNCWLLAHFEPHANNRCSLCPPGGL